MTQGGHSPLMGRFNHVIVPLLRAPSHHIPSSRRLCPSPSHSQGAFEHDERHHNRY
jgi:hypothetical protein